VPVVIPKVRTSAVIAAPPDQVWTILRDFNGLPGWHPAVIESAIENGDAIDRIGCVRQYRRKDGAVIRERLVALDELGHSLSYTLLDAPLPVKGYVATLRLTRITETNRTFAEWLAWYDCAAQDEGRLRESIHEVFQIGFDTLKRKFQ
jgi:hypothetical protein